MTLTSPHLVKPVLATRESIEAIIRTINQSKHDPFVILSGTDDLVFMQTLLTPEGFSLEYQDGSLETHYETIRSDLSANDIIEAFCEYADGSTMWRSRFDFRRQEVRSSAFRLGYTIGNFIGRIRRLFSIS